MKKIFPLTIVFLGAIAIGLVLWLGSDRASATATFVPTAAATPAAGRATGGPGQPDPNAIAPGPAKSGTPTGRASGIPAIQPRHAVSAVGQAVFDAQDAIDFVLLHGVQGIRISGEGPVVVESVRFLSAPDADAQFHLDSGQAADTLLCVVTVSGTFVMHTPMPGPGHDRTFHQAMLVFDGSSGNLLQLSEATSAP